jgi:hypothetical protein
MAFEYALAVIGTVAEYTPVDWAVLLMLKVNVLPLVVAESQVAVGAPATIGGLVVDNVLSLPTIVTLWLLVLAPEVIENVVEAGMPSSTGVFNGVTRILTATW